MHSVMRGAAISAALVVPLALAACGNRDLTRSRAAEILDGPAFSTVCVAQPSFVDGGFQRAQASGAVAAKPSAVGWFGLGNVYKVADLPNGDEWRAVSDLSGGMAVLRKSQPLQCFSGHAEITAIADSPISQNGSYKLVDFQEVIDLPPELEKLRPYLYLRYQKEANFQKTDDGWRIAP